MPINTRRPARYKSTVSDSRRAPRFDVSIQAEVFTGEALFIASTRNLSTGGVGLISDRQLTQGSTIGLNLYLVVDGIEDAQSTPLQLKGRVAWCLEAQKGTFSAGIKFEEMNVEQRLLVDRYIRSLMPT